MIVSSCGPSEGLLIGAMLVGKDRQEAKVLRTGHASEGSNAYGNNTAATTPTGVWGTTAVGRGEPRSRPSGRILRRYGVGRIVC